MLLCTHHTFIGKFHMVCTKNLMSLLWANLELSVWFDTILNSLKRNTFAINQFQKKCCLDLWKKSPPPSVFWFFFNSYLFIYSYLIDCIRLSNNRKNPNLQDSNLLNTLLRSEKLIFFQILFIHLFISIFILKTKTWPWGKIYMCTINEFSCKNFKTLNKRIMIWNR